MSPSDPQTPPDPANNPAGDGIDVTEKAVAQGGLGTHAFTILIISTVLVVVVLFAAFGLSAFFKGGEGPHGSGVGGAKEQSAIFNSTDTPSPKQTPPPKPPGS